MDDQSEAAVREVAKRSTGPVEQDDSIVGANDDPWSAFAIEDTAVPARPPNGEPGLIEVSGNRAFEIAGWSSLPGWRTLIGDRLPWALLFFGAVGASVGAYALWTRADRADPPGAVQTGNATITSRPDGLQVVIDEQVRGNTPLTLTLPLGVHQMRIQAGSEVRSVPLTIAAGTSVSQYIDLGTASSEPTTGGSSVTDGGKNPPSRTNATGERVVDIGGSDRAMTRAGTVPPGGAASVGASAPLGTGGWVTFKAPFEMQVLEDGHLVGTTGVERLMLPVGPHRLDLLNEQLEFRTTMTIAVAGGAAITQVVKQPDGLLSVNALPWADVRIDGRPAGTTPLANIVVPIGPHEIVWTHPQLGERRQTVMVKAKTPTRIGLTLDE